MHHLKWPPRPIENDKSFQNAVKKVLKIISLLKTCLRVTKMVVVFYCGSVFNLSNVTITSLFYTMEGQAIKKYVNFNMQEIDNVL